MSPAMHTMQVIWRTDRIHSMWCWSKPQYSESSCTSCTYYTRNINCGAIHYCQRPFYYSDSIVQLQIRTHQNIPPLTEHKRDCALQTHVSQDSPQICKLLLQFLLAAWKSYDTKIPRHSGLRGRNGLVHATLTTGTTAQNTQLAEILTHATEPSQQN